VHHDATGAGGVGGGNATWQRDHATPLTGAATKGERPRESLPSVGRRGSEHRETASFFIRKLHTHISFDQKCRTQMGQNGV